MSQRIQVKKTRRRRAITYVWILGLLLAVSLLIYFERTALLYVLATLGVTALLIVVAVADLGADETASNATLTDAQAAGATVSSDQSKRAKK